MIIAVIINNNNLGVVFQGNAHAAISFQLRGLQSRNNALHHYLQKGFPTCILVPGFM